MTKITQIDDRSAASAWCPIRESADVIALGAKDSGGSGFEDTGGELELYDLLTSDATESPKLLGSVKTQSRFASLAWTPGTLGGKYPLGLLAGGMENGKIHVWDPQAVMTGKTSSSLVATYALHAAGPVKALNFSVLNPMQLATGGSDGRVIIFHLDQPDGGPLVPSDSHQQQAQITAVAWNTQVAHIVASAAADGTVTVWDLKNRKAWCELRGETAGQAVADLAWNPTQGLHLLTASADDRNPVIKLWDLRASTSMPLTTLAGHQKGILSMGWCPHDDHLLLTCAKDNRTILWDLSSLQPIGEVPNDLAPQGDSGASGHDVFATSGLASSQQRRYSVQWSPIKRGVALTCSLDRKVQAHSILSLSSQSGRPPKWMRPASSVSCGFGASVVSCGSLDKIVTLRTVPEQPALAQISNMHEGIIQSVQVIEYCQKRAANATSAGEAQLWAFMQVIFETNARQQLLDTLDFHPNDIAEAVSNYVEDPTVNGVENMSLKDSGVCAMTSSTEAMVKKALLVGNFEAAVECCFRTGNLAEALVLASCGGPDLWAKAQQRYFDTQSSKRPFLSTVSSIIRNELFELVKNSDPKNWHETLAILSTYGKSDQFPDLCIALGDILEQAGDDRSASLCYMCSLSLERAVKFWRTQLKEANEKKGGLDLAALHDFVVKVSVFQQAVGPNVTLEPEDGEMFSQYAIKLAEQGLLVAAAKYCKGDSEESKMLRDRLYRGKASPEALAAMGGVAPEFPFDFQEVKKSRGPTVQRTNQRAAAQSVQATTQNAYANTQAYANTNATSYGYAATQSTSAPAQTSSDELPPGWMALQDPSSGNYYYANQATGEVTWDRPQPVAAPAPAPTVMAVPQPQPASEQPMQAAAAPAAGRPSTLASKYGDGFVTSSSHPELAQQYGNVGTSNPYATTARPGTAQVPGVATPAKAPVSTDLDLDKINELREDYLPVKECLLSLMEALKNVELNAVERRLLAEAEKAVAVLLKRLTRGQISDEIGEKVISMCNTINSYDFRGAQAIQTGLVNSDWRDHKDWLKGTKSLLQLATKKFGQ